jgi:hypothetical protein
MPENLLEQWPERVICVSLILLWFRNFRGRATSTASLATYRSYRMLLDQVLVQVENLFANLELEPRTAFAGNRDTGFSDSVVQGKHGNVLLTLRLR